MISRKSTFQNQEAPVGTLVLFLRLMLFQLKLRPRSGVIWRENLTIFDSFFCKHLGSVQYFRTADRLFAYQSD
jgi:hypothetical protein